VRALLIPEHQFEVRRAPLFQQIDSAAKSAKD
jgi:hypothetical protein